VLTFRAHPYVQWYAEQQHQEPEEHGLSSTAINRPDRKQEGNDFHGLEKPPSRSIAPTSAPITENNASQRTKDVWDDCCHRTEIHDEIVERYERR